MKKEIVTCDICSTEIEKTSRPKTLTLRDGCATHVGDKNLDLCERHYLTLLKFIESGAEIKVDAVDSKASDIEFENLLYAARGVCRLASNGSFVASDFDGLRTEINRMRERVKKIDERQKQPREQTSKFVDGLQKMGKALQPEDDVKKSFDWLKKLIDRIRIWENDFPAASLGQRDAKKCFRHIRETLEKNFHSPDAEPVGYDELIRKVKEAGERWAEATESLDASEFGGRSIAASNFYRAVDALTHPAPAVGKSSHSLRPFKFNGESGKSALMLVTVDGIDEAMKKTYFVKRRNGVDMMSNVYAEDLFEWSMTQTIASQCDHNWQQDSTCEWVEVCSKCGEGRA